MKKIIIFGFASLLLWSCNTLKVSMDYDRDVDFNKFKSFKFTEEAKIYPGNELNRRRVLAAIESEMQKEGFGMSENADVWIDIEFNVVEQQSATATTSSPHSYWGGGYRYGYGMGFSTTTINYNTYEVGTIFINMIDASNQQLVWQGRGEKTVNPTAKNIEQRINDGIAKIFTRYPPGK